MISILSGCFVVRIVESTKKEKCNLLTKELKVTFSEKISAKFVREISNTKEGIALLIVLPPVSLIVSGSISVVGNTIHWIEKQGKCEDSRVQEFLRTVNQSTLSVGGRIITTKDSFLQWFLSLQKEIL